MSNPIITLEGVEKAFGKNLVVKKMNLEIGEGEFLTLLGPSGCGKTTTLRMIAGFEDATTGVIKAFMKKMHERGPKVVTVTRGSEGSISYDGENFYKFGIVPCEVADTMGAGDSFIAGFLYAVCAGKTIPEAMADGAANSSITIAYSGAW